jgi:4-amino-4-deoxy-L-arabinose transferase-like glycosyltransferase
MNRMFLSVLLLLSFLGAASIFYAVPSTAGGTWDTVVYVGVARNLASGTGFYLAHSLPKRPFTHWAPLYPLILAVPAYFGIDPVESAKWMNMLLWGYSIFVAGIIAWRSCGRSWIYGLLAAVFLLVSSDMIEIFAQVLSEGLFIALLLSSVFLLCYYKESGNSKSMIGAGIVLSAALLTRYAGAFFFIAALPIVFSWRDLKQKVRSAILFCSIVALPSAAWIAHNLRSGGEAAGERRLIYHRLSATILRDFLKNVSLWFSPPWLPVRIRLLVTAGLLAIILGAVVSVFRRNRLFTDSGVHPTVLLAKICVVFGSVYLVFLFLTMAFLDALTKPNLRLLGPIYPITVLLLVSSLALWGEKLGQQSVRWRLLSITCLLLVILNAAHSLGTVRDIRQNGIGFQTATWRDDEIMRVVRELPDNVTSYSDNPTLIYFFTKRALYFPPQKFDMVTAQANPRFEEEMNSLVKNGNQRPVVIVSFGRWKDGPFSTASELVEQWGFQPVFQSTNGNYVLCSSACGTLKTKPYSIHQ